MTTRLWQRDPHWQHLFLGNSKSSTIGRYGCLLTSIAMCADMHSVIDLNTCHRLHGGFRKEPLGAYMASFDVQACVPWLSLRYTSRIYSSPVPDAEMALLYDHLQRGPAVIEVDIRGDAGYKGHRDNQHFVCAAGTVGGIIQINDPWDGVSKTLTPRYGTTNERAIWRFLLYEVEK